MIKYYKEFLELLSKKQILQIYYSNFTDLIMPNMHTLCNVIYSMHPSFPDKFPIYVGMVQRQQTAFRYEMERNVYQLHGAFSKGIALYFCDFLVCILPQDT